MQRRSLTPTHRFLAFVCALAGTPLVAPKRHGFAITLQRRAEPGDRVLFSETEEISFAGDERLFCEQIGAKLDRLIEHAFAGEERTIELRTSIGFEALHPDGAGIVCGEDGTAKAETRKRPESAREVGTRMHKNIANKLANGATRMQALEFGEPRIMRAEMSTMKIEPYVSRAFAKEAQAKEQKRREHGPHKNKLQRKARKKRRG